MNYRKGWIDDAANAALDIQANLSELRDLISSAPCDRSRSLLERALRHNRELVAMVEARREKARRSEVRP